MNKEELQVLQALEVGLTNTEFLADVADYKSDESALRQKEVQQIKAAIFIVERWDAQGKQFDE